jgi:hypothetical protein
LFLDNPAILCARALSLLSTYQLTLQRMKIHSLVHSVPRYQGLTQLRVSSHLKIKQDESQRSFESFTTNAARPGPRCAYSIATTGWVRLSAML